MSNWIDTTSTGALRTETDHRREELTRSWSHRRHVGSGTPRPTTPRPTTPRRRVRRRWWSPAPAGA